jgi:hypothetical protein
MDINTLSETAYELNKESLLRFLEQGSDVMKETLESHLKVWRE